MMCDSKTLYTVSALPYVGKGTDNGQIPLADYFVKELTKPIYRTNRNITTDNRFTSVLSVLHDHKLTMVRTLRRNKQEIPTKIVDVKRSPVGTSLFIFDKEMMITSFYPWKNKMVLLLSTTHQGKEVDTNSPKKTEIVEFYNKTKGGVDALDQLCITYSCSRKTRRWPLRVFYALLNMVQVNAIVILNSVMVSKSEMKLQEESFSSTLVSKWSFLDSKEVNNTNSTYWSKEPHPRSSRKGSTR
jgi:hypothetical protein